MDHGIQRQFLTSLGPIPVVDGVQPRILRDWSQHGHLGQIEFTHRLAKVNLRRRLDPICKVSVKVQVQVPFKDLFLAETARNGQGEDNLFDLARIAALVALLKRDQHVLDQLLGE